MKITNKVLAVLISSSFACSAVNAGIMVKQKSGDNIEAHIFQSGTYINQQNGTLSAIIDFNSNNCTQLNHSEKSYFMGDCKGMAPAFKSFMSSKVEEGKAAMSSEDQAYMKQMMEQMLPKQSDVKITVKKEGSTSIQGYDSDLYVLKVGDEKVSEIWVSKALEKDISKEIDIKKLDKLSKEFKETMGGMQEAMFGKKMKNPEKDAEATLDDKGYFIKRIKYGNGMFAATPDTPQKTNSKGDTIRDEQEVISVEKKKFDLAKYSVPKDYQAATSWKDFVESSIKGF